MASQPQERMLAEPKTVGDLLRDRYPLWVPNYQRSYAWSEEEVQDFCEDLLALRELALARPLDEASHFFGGLVTIHHLTPGSPGHSYEVVDGQQRLATFGILFSALAHELGWLQEAAISTGAEEVKFSASERASELWNGTLTFSGLGSMPGCHHRLRLSGVDQDFYAAIINNPTASPVAAPNRESHQKLTYAKKALLRLVQSLSRDNTRPLSERLNAVLSLVDVALKRSTVIHMMSSERAEAYRVFLILNNRGKNLATGDLLRATTLQRVDGHPDETRIVTGAWDNILSEPENQIEAFLKGSGPVQASCSRSSNVCTSPRA